jgi:hypothetical protein
VIARLLPYRNIGTGYAVNVNDIFKNPKDALYKFSKPHLRSGYDPRTAAKTGFT